MDRTILILALLDNNSAIIPESAAV